MLRYGEPITSVSLGDAVETGLTLGTPIPGFVAELECREAAIFGGYRWIDWIELSRQEQADSVAHYRLHLLIKMHQDDAVTKERKPKTRPSARKH